MTAIARFDHKSPEAAGRISVRRTGDGGVSITFVVTQGPPKLGFSLRWDKGEVDKVRQYAKSPQHPKHWIISDEGDALVGRVLSQLIENGALAQYAA